jgi:hypothetical protein
MIEIKTKFGIHEIVASGKDLKEAIAAISLLAELPREGPDGEEVAFHHRVGKDKQSGDLYDYYSLRAGDQEFALGQSKSGGKLFPKGPWREVRRGGGDPSESRPTAKVGYEDDVPF